MIRRMKRRSTRWAARRNPPAGYCYNCGAAPGTLHKPGCYDSGVWQPAGAPALVPAPRPASVPAQKPEVDRDAIAELCREVRHRPEDAWMYSGDLYCRDCAVQIMVDKVQEANAKNMTHQLSDAVCRRCGGRAPVDVIVEGTDDDEVSTLCCRLCRATRGVDIDDYDSGSWPQNVSHMNDESDSPSHCGSGQDCINAITMPDGGKIGAWLGNGLTSEGTEYVKESCERGSDVGLLWACLYDIDCGDSDSDEDDAGEETPEQAAARGTFLDTLLRTDKFVIGYLDAMLWSSTDGDPPEPLDKNYDLTHISLEALHKAKEDCDEFRCIGFGVIGSIPVADDLYATGASDERNGHDFWLTRNGHGVGFQDRGYGDAGDRLDKEAAFFGEINPYVGDDGLIYFM